MNDSLVSIIVAIYNVEKFLPVCIESLIHQDYSNVEIILVDDCSTDRSLEICRTYEKIDSRIKVVHHEHNSKQATVRNTGLIVATGEYITFVDGDDWLADDFVSYMKQVIDKYDSDMAINLVNFTTRDMVQVENFDTQVWSSEKATAEILFPHLTVGCWNKLYKKKFIDTNHLKFKTHLFTAEGDRFIIDAAQRANNVAVGHKKVYYYRLNNVNSAVTKPDIRQSKGAIDAFEEIENDLVLRTPLVLAALNQHKWLNHLWNISQILNLKKTKEFSKEYKMSIKYVRANYWNVVRNESNFKRKVSFFLTGLFPVITTIIRNNLNYLKLQKDMKSLRNVELS